ncbi:ribonuclease H-like domain-containing protein, partial [Tanacetum coccineum]
TCGLGVGQKEGMDYEETFSPVVKMMIVRCLLNIVMSNSWHVFQLDVNNAFLYGDLDEVVYMKPPEGFSQSKSDYFLYTKYDKGVFLALLVYVDDIMITGNNVYEIEKFKVFLKSKFMIKDLGKHKYFLGIEVVDIHKGICLNQRKYVLDLYSEHGLGIHIVKTSGMFLNAYSDVDWAKCVITRKSVIGYCVFLNDSLVSWKNKKYNILSKSSTQAQYRALIAANLVFHERTKHLEIDLRLVREKILKRVVKTIKVDSANQIADIQTKGLDTLQHTFFVEKLGMLDVYQCFALEEALGSRLT